MGPYQDGVILVGTGPVGGPAFVGVSRFFQPYQVQQQGRFVRSPLVTQPRLYILVGAFKGLIQGRFTAGVCYVNMVLQTVSFNLLPVYPLTGPVDGAGLQARLSPGLSSGEEALVLLLFQVVNMVQSGILLLQIGGNHKGGSPVVPQAGSQVEYVPGRQGSFPLLNLTGKPDLHQEVNVSVAKALEQGYAVAGNLFGGVPITMLDHIAGDFGL